MSEKTIKNNKTLNKIFYIVSAVILAVLACLLIVFGVVNSLPRLSSFAAFFVLTAFSLIFFVHTAIHKTPISLYIAVLFLVPALIEIIVLYSQVGYSQIYPLYIAMPFFASLFCAVCFLRFKPHIIPLIFFGTVASLFALQSSGVGHLVDARGGWAFLMPLVAAVIVATIFVVVYLVVKREKPKKGEEAEEVNCAESTEKENDKSAKEVNETEEAIEKSKEMLGRAEEAIKAKKVEKEEK